MIHREVTVGRAANCDIFLNSQCQYASKYHATIFISGSQLIYKDTSTNGTVINGVNVKNSSVPIRRGDRILISGRYPLSWQQLDRYFPNISYLSSANVPVIEDTATGTGDSEKVDKWSWGAFGLYPIWGFFNGCWWAIFIAIFFGWTFPIPNIIFGIFGCNWAWKLKSWRDINHFSQVQHKWNIAGAIVFGLNMLMSLIAILFFTVFLTMI